MPSLNFKAPHLVSECLDDSGHVHNTILMDIHGDIENECSQTCCLPKWDFRVPKRQQPL